MGGLALFPKQKLVTDIGYFASLIPIYSHSLKHFNFNH